MDALIDPSTRDYELLDGVAKRGELFTACYLRLSIPLRSYWADRTLGSRLHELQRMKDVPRMSKLAKQYAEQALAPILNDGRAASITVTTDQPRDGRLHLLIAATTAKGDQFNFKYPVGVI